MKKTSLTYILKNLKSGENMLLTYKSWKSLNESIMPSFNLGLKSPNNLGIRNQFDFEEAKKKSKKKMEDGEIVDPAAEKDKPEIDVKVDDNDDDNEGCDTKMCGKMAKKKSKKKMWSDEDDAPEATDSVKVNKCGDKKDLEDEEEDDSEGEGENMEKPMFSKKSKKKMKEASEEEDWWNSVRNMVNSSPDQKYDDGCADLFKPIDTENLTQAVRDESGR